jgi:hypothetical protein
MEKRRITPAFEFNGVTIPISKLIPTKVLPVSVIKSTKYKQTETSIREIGIIEPPVVFKKKDPSGNYLLLDGHLRIQVLENLGKTEVFCLLSTDDEAYTYNKMVNSVSAVQEHYMVMKALDRGVSDTDLAKHLGVNVGRIKEKRNLLRDICPEAVDLLKKRDVPATTFQVLRKMKPMRQLQTAELMIGANNFSSTFAKAMLATTPPGLLEISSKAKKEGEENLSPEQLASMESELANLETEYRLAEQNLGTEVLSMVVYRGYLVRLMNNHEVVDFLKQHQPDILQEFQVIIKRTATDGPEL